MEVVGLTEVTRHYNGTALVFVLTNSSEVPGAYKANAIVPDGENYWLFRFKQLYASDPFDWDTDHDGLCDGNCSGEGEDLNLNGYRDQDSDGNWTGTGWSWGV